MRIEPGYDTAGRTALEIICRGATQLMRDGRYGGKALVGPATFQLLQEELARERVLTARGEWDGSRPYLRLAICGREMVINMSEDVPEHHYELAERGGK
jgi:hypothetical protein